MKNRKYIIKNGKQIPYAVIVAEGVLGKRLPLKAIVHHANGDYFNDAQSNLVICPDRVYHNLLHARMDALASCGNANWRRCNICKKYDAPENLYLRDKYGMSGWHRACHAKRELARWRKANGRHL